MVYRQLAQEAFESYKALTGSAVEARKSASMTALTPVPLGHPAFTQLQLGETASSPLAVGFVDLRRFTPRSFWDDPRDTVLLARKFLDMAAYIVRDCGGHVLGYRGDGVFAGFGGPDAMNQQIQVRCAFDAFAAILDTTRNAFNELLEADGIEPVQARCGLDHGEIYFTRCGTEEANEVNEVGFPANFASKLEHKAYSWELLVGEGAAAHLEEDLLETPKETEPYERGEERREYGYWRTRWSHLVSEAAGLASRLNGRTSSQIAELSVVIGGELAAYVDGSGRPLSEAEGAQLGRRRRKQQTFHDVDW